VALSGVYVVTFEGVTVHDCAAARPAIRPNKAQDKAVDMMRSEIEI